MIKLIASDIDGTLLPEGTDKINPEIFEVIRKLKEKGINCYIQYTLKCKNCQEKNHSKKA